MHTRPTSALLTSPQTDIGQSIGRWDMNSRVIRARRSAMRKRARDELIVNAFRPLDISTRRLHGKRIRLQPIQQRRFAKETGIRMLWRMSVRVDEAREVEARPFIYSDDVCVLPSWSCLLERFNGQLGKRLFL